VQLTKQKIYKKVYEISRAELEQSNPEPQFAAAGLRSQITDQGFAVEMRYFDEIITLTVPGFIFQSSRGSNITLVAKIILLHYINRASGAALGDDKVPYQDIPGLRDYYPVFEKRVLKPLLSAFGYDGRAFLDAGLSLGGFEEEYGDASFTLYALPRIPITFILWQGDQEFPPTMQALFDPTIPGYLPLEDIVVISKLAAARILKSARLQHNTEVYDDF
jgi:hypothetical protein